MRLSLVTETFPPEINGVAMTLQRLTDGLHQRGLAVEVIVPQRPDRHPSGHIDLLQVPGRPLPRYPELRFGLPAFRTLSRHWHAAPPDLIHIATEGPLGLAALEVAHHLEIPTVSSFHTNFHAYSNHYGFGLLNRAVLAWLRWFHNRTRRTFVPSDDTIAALASARFHNLRRMARGVDTRRFNPNQRSDALRQAWGVAPDSPVALYVGRLAAEKNLDLTIRAFLQLKAALPNAHMLFVGDGPARAAAAQQLPTATFAGMQQGDALAAHYASADIFLFASITETFGNVVTEAMASALPVVAFDYAAPQRFIQHAQSGFLAPYNNPAAFLEATELAAARRADWPRIGLNARAATIPLSWDAVIDAYLHDIRAVLPFSTHPHHAHQKTLQAAPAL